MTDVLDIETVTTLPILPLEHPVFIEQVFNKAEPERIPFTRDGDPWWAILIVVLGALVAIGSGSFIISLQLLA
jgi:hypothetical protein